MQPAHPFFHLLYFHRYGWIGNEFHWQLLQDAEFSQNACFLHPDCNYFWCSSHGEEKQKRLKAEIALQGMRPVWRKVCANLRIGNDFAKIDVVGETYLSKLGQNNQKECNQGRKASCLHQVEVEVFFNHTSQLAN
jgi:hypothetical protein